MFQAGHQLHLPDQLDRATCPRHGLRGRGLAPFFKGHGVEDIGLYIIYIYLMPPTYTVLMLSRHDPQILGPT